jgi:ABC-type polysaccharide/polyol phosphate transport system ATPase subunit
MTVHLAFAISTAVRGNILLLDEILAGGNDLFLEKARNRMEK